MTVDVSQTGYQMELDAILAVVIGGTSLAGGKFSIVGAAVGALLIATLDKTVVFLGVPPSATPAFKAIVIIVLCLLQSERVRARSPPSCKRRQAPPPARLADPRQPKAGRRMSTDDHHGRPDVTPAGLTSALRPRGTCAPTATLLPTLAAVVLFVGMLIYGELAYGRIIQYGTLSNLLINNAHLDHPRRGLTFVILTGGIDLSVGAVIACQLGRRA